MILLQKTKYTHRSGWKWRNLAKATNLWQISSEVDILSVKTIDKRVTYTCNPRRQDKGEINENKETTSLLRGLSNSFVRQKVIAVNRYLRHEYSNEERHSFCDDKLN